MPNDNDTDQQRQAAEPSDLDNGTESTREAAWHVCDVLDYGAMTFDQVAGCLNWSHATLRRAVKLLRDANVIEFDRHTGLLSRTDGTTIPPRLRPRWALVAAIEAYEELDAARREDRAAERADRLAGLRGEL